ncbi:uncharacterized protein LOC108700612 isoform X2 [Xenopus laevis]|uniref:Uncharacterized protein LOC108700612 isoform X2 n=1 Tax=Xenopus laevis TaxID=8355 RepID=A0A8J1LP44_XENLA|nr:uncharacterized protein LOC108700612 isoform X2 [Xenopus laevis]
MEFILALTLAMYGTIGIFYYFKKKSEFDKLGDLIEFDRGDNKLWGVYVGFGIVVYRDKDGVVTIDHIRNIAGSGTFKVNNKFDEKLKPRSGELVAKKAWNQLSVKSAEENDELFVTRLRYGIACSDENPPPDAGEILRFSFHNQEHWGIYIGDRDVIYLNRETAYVQQIDLDYLKDIRIIRKYDHKLKPKKQDNITMEAKKRVGEKMTWGEDTDQLFATELRYGLKFSDKQPPPEPGDLIEFVRLWGIYRHWGVYVGDGNLVHLQSDLDSIFTSLFKTTSSSRDFNSVFTSLFNPESSFKEQWQALTSSKNSVDFKLLLDSETPIEEKRLMMAKAIILDIDGKILEEPVESVANGSVYRVNNSYDKYYRPSRSEDIVKLAKQHVGQNMTYNLVKFNCEHFSTLMRYGVAFSKQIDDWMKDPIFNKQIFSSFGDTEASPRNAPTLSNGQNRVRLRHNTLTL